MIWRGVIFTVFILSLTTKACRQCPNRKKSVQIDNELESDIIISITFSGVPGFPKKSYRKDFGQIYISSKNVHERKLEKSILFFSFPLEKRSWAWSHF